MYMLYLYFIIFCCFLNFSLKKHFMMLLLSLELMLITIFMLMILKKLYILGLMLLSLGACEGALGLSLLMSLSGVKNKFYLNSFFMTKC